MSKLRLAPDEIRELVELLRKAFLRVRFEEFLFYRLKTSTDDLTGPNDDYPTVLRKVVQEANAKLWWRNLLQAARNAVPADPGLQSFGEDFGVSPITVEPSAAGSTRLTPAQLELKIKKAQSTFDILKWRKHIGEIEGRVCRIEYPPTEAQGTGFLISRTAVLTNYHVIEPIHKGDVPPGQVALRFDYKVLDDGVTVSSGNIHRLAKDKEWLADWSPYSPRDEEVAPSADPNPDELDYAILSLEGSPGEEPVGGQTDDPKPTPRRWVEIPEQEHDFNKFRALYIVQHPDGKPMQIALDTEAVVGLNGNRTRVKYTTTTEPGSSGSPCFGPDWQCVALHHSGDPKYLKGQKPDFNQGIPLTAIRRLLHERGKSALLGGS
jgi:hypothetical protein